MIRKAVAWGFILGGVVALALRGRVRGDGLEADCQGDPPEPYPATPAGWTLYRGAVSAVASQTARSALALSIGESLTFTDDDGRLRGILVTWHCHSADSGMRPVGWHKGATLFDVA